MIGGSRPPHMTAVASVTVLWVSLLAVTYGQEWRTGALAAFDDVWQTVWTTYYDPSFGGVDWNEAKREFRPRVEAAHSPEEARTQIRAMLGMLGQSHFAILPASSNDGPRGTAAPAQAGEHWAAVVRAASEVRPCCPPTRSSGAAQ